MKIDNIKEEVAHDIEYLKKTTKKKMKQKHKTQWKATPAD
jgi:hypothetical protein